MTGEEAVERLDQFVGKGTYGLGAGAGPNSPTPFNAAGACDCIAAVMWAWKQARHDGGFPEYEGDINVDSALMDAGAIPGGFGRQRYFKLVPVGEAILGDIVMYPSVRASELGDTSFPPQTRLRIGHTGFVRGLYAGDTNIKSWWILECSAGNPAIKDHKDVNFSANSNRKIVEWKGKTFASDKWQTRVVRYIGPSSRAA